jgi:hypothetical protein
MEKWKCIYVLSRTFKTPRYCHRATLFDHSLSEASHDLEAPTEKKKTKSISYRNDASCSLEEDVAQSDPERR